MHRLHLFTVIFWVMFLVPIVSSAQQQDRTGFEKTPTTQGTLDRKLPELRFQQNELRDIVEFFGDVTGSTMCVDWASVEAAGVKPNALVSCKVRDISVSDAITKVLSVAAGGPKKLTFELDHGIIMISTPAGLEVRHKNLASKTEKFPFLAGHVAKVKLDMQPLSSVLDALEKAGGHPIHCDLQQMAKDGIRGQNISLDLKEEPLGVALQFVAEQASNDKATVDFRIEGDKIEFFDVLLK